MKILITTPSLAVHGGIRIILEWANSLSLHNDVYLLNLSGKNNQPCNWFTISSRVKQGDAAMLWECDMVILTSPHSAPLLDLILPGQQCFLFLQMMEHMFRPTDINWLALCKKFYTAHYPLISISAWNTEMLMDTFKREREIYYVGNGVNLQMFPAVETVKDGKTILVEGLETTNPTKDIDGVALQVVKRLKKEGYKILSYAAVPLKNSNVVDEHYVNPSPAKLNELYTRAAILLKATKYDARSCAPVEAMTKGTVTARAIIQGDDDLIHHENCLRCGYNATDLYAIAKQLLTDNALRQRLAANCLQYVQQYNWQHWMPQIENILGIKPVEKQKVKTVIISVVYEEPEWQQTKQNIEACSVPVVYANRNGTGSLAKAINDGFKEAVELYDFTYAWIVTNIGFNPDILPALEQQMDETCYAAIHPAFDSDHIHLQKLADGHPELVDSEASRLRERVQLVPFVEFTAPIIRRDVFELCMLDEDMPYWGHDLDWGYRINSRVLSVAVDYTNAITHTYNRFMNRQHPVTAQRRQLRRSTDAQTTQALKTKYGANWQQLVFPKTKEEIEKYFERLGKGTRNLQLGHPEPVEGSAQASAGVKS